MLYQFGAFRRFIDIFGNINACETSKKCYSKGSLVLSAYASFVMY